MSRTPRIVLAFVGTPRDSPLDRSTSDYVARIDRMVGAEARWLRAAAGDGPAAVRADSDRVAAALGAAGTTWLLEPAGRAGTSEDWAEWIARDIEERPSPLAIVVGGAAGLDPARLGRLDRRLALSRLTLPHAIARLLAAEQAYRALTMWKGLPYHK